MYKHFCVQKNREMLRFEEASSLWKCLSCVHLSNSICTNMFKEFCLPLVTAVKLTGSVGSAI